MRSITITVLTLFVLALSTTLLASPAKTPVVGQTAPATQPVVPKTLQTFVAPTKRPTEAKELRQLVSAIKAIEDKGVRMTDRRRLKIAKAALAASKLTGVDATLMVAIGRMESDFRPLQVIGWGCKGGPGRCIADCGITQHNITGNPKYVKRQCRKLAYNYRLSFKKSAQEIASHIRFCRKRAKRNQPLRRCVLNRYNGGTFYLTDRRCSSRWRYCKKSCPTVQWNSQDLTKAEKEHQYKRRKQCQNRCYRVKRKCQYRARYWVKVLCFDFGARNGVRARRSCRRIWSVRDIATKHYRPTKPKSPVRTAEQQPRPRPAVR